jgi:DNA helicase II / ATP-dependent DNA helicase PcrA
MRFHADLHVHSKYSRATSRDLDLEHLAAWAVRKGLAVVATGDFTHPAWRAELKEKLVPAEPGLFRLRPEIEQAVAEGLPPACRTPVRFMLEVEISTIYKKGEKTRKVHHLSTRRTSRPPTAFPSAWRAPATSLPTAARSSGSTRATFSRSR